MSLLLLFFAALLAGNGLGKIVGFRRRAPAKIEGHFTAAQIEETGRVAMRFYSCPR